MTTTCVLSKARQGLCKTSMNIPNALVSILNFLSWFCEVIVPCSSHQLLLPLQAGVEWRQGTKVPRSLGSHGVSLQGCFLALHKSSLGQSEAGHYFSGIIGKCLRPRFSSCLRLTGRHQFCSTIKRLNPPSPPVQPRISPVSRYLLPQFAPRPAIDRPTDQPRRLANAHDGVPETRSEPFQGPH